MELEEASTKPTSRKIFNSSSKCINQNVIQEKITKYPWFAIKMDMTKTDVHK